MKLQLDTNSKTIKLEESINLGEFQELLEKILPNDQWKEYKLETNTTISWQSPIIIDRYNPAPYYPWWSPQPYVVTNEVIYNEQQGSASGNNGVFSLSVN